MSSHVVPGVLIVGLTRFSLPLGSTLSKKFERLRPVANLHVVSFGKSTRFESMREPVHLYLAPLLPSSLVRFTLLFFYALIVGWRLGWSGRVQILIGESPYEALVCLILKQLLGLTGRQVSLVTEVHGDWMSAPFLYHRVPMASLLRLIMRVWSGFVLRRSDVIRTVSRFLENQVEAIAPAVPRCVFPAYTDFELYFNAARPERRGERIVSVGALYPVKGFTYLIRALKKVVAVRPNVRLSLVGVGPLSQSLKQEVEELGIRERVDFQGWLPPAQVKKELLSSQLMVLPSLSEGLGRVLIEAMACGLPIVATNIGGIPELVHKDVGFLVPSRDSAALAEKMIWLLEHPERAEAMGATGRRNVQRTYSTDRYVDSYRSLFRLALEVN